MPRNLQIAVKNAAGANRIATAHLMTMYLDAQTIYWIDYHRNVVWNGQTYYAAGQLLTFDGLEETSDIQINSCTIQISGVDPEKIGLVLQNLYINRRVTIHRAFFDPEGSGIPSRVVVSGDGAGNYYFIGLLNDRPDFGSLFWAEGFWRLLYGNQLEDVVESDSFLPPKTGWTGGQTLEYEVGQDILVYEPVLVFDGLINRPVIEEDPENGTATISIEAANQFADFERRPGRHTSNAEQQLFYPGDKGMEYASQQDRNITWGS